MTTVAHQNNSLLTMIAASYFLLNIDDLRHLLRNRDGVDNVRMHRLQ